MKYIFLLFYVVFVFLMFREVCRLINNGNSKEAMIGLFMSFALVPDFIIFDAYGIPGTFIIVFLFMCLIPFIGIIKSHILRFRRGDVFFIIMIAVIFVYALYTKYVKGIITDYYDTKLFGYIYTLIIPIIVIMHYKESIIKSYDLWKPILLYAIIAYAFKNFFLAGVLGFRNTYVTNYEELKNVIFAARILAIGVVICIYDLLRRYEFKTLIYIAILLLQILLFESRGPILSVVLSTMIIWWFRSGKEKFKKHFNPRLLIGLSAFVVLAIVGFKYLWDAGYLERMVYKMNMFTTGNRNETRYYLYPITVEAIKQHMPWGLGFGNTKIGVMSINGYFNNNYPHNIILEMLLEEGIFITIPVLVILIRWFGSIITKDRYSYNTLLFFTLYVFSFVNSMFSGDIVGNSNLFFFGYLAYCSKLMSSNETVIDVREKTVGGYI